MGGWLRFVAVEIAGSVGHKDRSRFLPCGPGRGRGCRFRRGASRPGRAQGREHP